MSARAPRRPILRRAVVLSQETLPAPTGRPSGGDDAHDVVLLEDTLHAAHADGQQAHGARAAERIESFAGHVHLPFGESFRVGDPLLDARDGVGRGEEACAEGAASLGQQVGQDAVAAAVGDDRLDSLGGHLAGDAALGEHSAPSGTTTSRRGCSPAGRAARVRFRGSLRRPALPAYRCRCRPRWSAGRAPRRRSSSRAAPKVRRCR